MGFKVIKRLKVSSEKLFSESQYCLGDVKGSHAVVDKYNNPFYMGSEQDCQNYIDDIKNGKKISLNELISKINDIITRVNHHSPTANHLYRLKMRLLNGQKLTKKMKENLRWIEKELESEKLNIALMFAKELE